MNRIALFAALLLFVAPPEYSVAVEHDQDASRPNILFIMSDDHAAHAIGAYGGRLAGLNPTPHIDRLAKEGLRFSNVFCGNSICTPSRATILTGQHSHVNGVRTLRDSLAPEKQRLPQLMRRAGYETAVIGKWHLKAEPAAFDYYAVLPGQGKYFDPTLKVKGEGQFRRSGRQFQGHSSDVITDLSLAWLKQRKTDKPFFLMHHFKAPHGRWEPAKKYDNLYAMQEIPEPVSLYERAGHGPIARPQLGSSIGRRYKQGNMPWRLKMDESELKSLSDREYLHVAYQAYLKRYLRCVRGVDDNIGRLLSYLRESGELDNTLIIYTSDQGMFLGEHDYFDKRWMYEESLRMPFIVRYPKWVQGGRVNDDLISNTDFAPLLIEIAGGAAPKEMHGRSFLPMVKGKPAPNDWRDAVYYRYWMNMTPHQRPAHYGVRTKQHKLIYFYGKTDDVPFYEMYDLENDPQEMANVYGHADYAMHRERLKLRLAELQRQFGDAPEN